MFIHKFFNDDASKEAVYDYFSVLHEQYFSDQWKEATLLMQEQFDLDYETRYVIVDHDSGQLESRRYFPDRVTAEEFLSSLKQDGLAIALLFIEK